MEAKAGNSILDFETLFSDFQELLNGSGSMNLLWEDGSYRKKLMLGVEMTKFSSNCIQDSNRKLLFGSTSRIFGGGREQKFQDSATHGKIAVTPVAGWILQEEIFHGLVGSLYGTGWDRLDWDRLHRGYRSCPGTGTGLQRGYRACP